MSFKDLLQGANALNLAVFGESLTYLPIGGERRPITARVIRSREVRVDEVTAEEMVVDVLTLTCERTEEGGILVPRLGDRIEDGWGEDRRPFVYSGDVDEQRHGTQHTIAFWRKHKATGGIEG